ncbi:hypothetical protein GM3708_1124 [Geminocystis sp. NIES-3708]|nr:hypothetical protein GM3708_1124 [Geminocystis sp. NIES-3708]
MGLLSKLSKALIILICSFFGNFNKNFSAFFILTEYNQISSVS